MTNGLKMEEQGESKTGQELLTWELLTWELLKKVVRLAGIEPATLGFGGQYSIH